LRTPILSGLRIVELSAYVAAPFAGAVLAGLGAEVIRIEQVGGGIDARRWPLHNGQSLYRAGLDLGKRSVAIDLKSRRGMELAAAIITADGPDAGIFVTNVSHEQDLSYDSLRKRRSDLIMIELSGTPEGDVAVDYTVAASLGFPLVTGPVGHEGPVNSVLPAFDLVAGLHIALAVLVAERSRSRHGFGSFVQLALSDVGIKVAEHLGFLEEARLVEAPRARYGNAVYGTYGRDFETQDGRRLMVCALTERQWTSLVKVTGIEPEIASLSDRAGIDFADEGERFRHRSEIDDLLATWIGQRSLVEVADLFNQARLPWSPYRTFKEAFAKDSRVANPPMSALSFPDDAREQSLEAPNLGCSTGAVLEQILGLDRDEIRSLVEQRVIALGQHGDRASSEPP